MSGICYVVFAGVSVSPFRVTNLETIDATELSIKLLENVQETSRAIFNETEEEAANNQLTREDATYPFRYLDTQHPTIKHPQMNVNIKFKLHCSKEEFLSILNDYQERKILSKPLPIEQKIEAKIYLRANRESKMTTVINKALLDPDPYSISSHFNAGKKAGKDAFKEYSDLLIVTQESELAGQVDTSLLVEEVQPTPQKSTQESSYEIIFSKIPPGECSTPLLSQPKAPNLAEEQYRKASQNRYRAIGLIILGILTLPLAGIGLLPLIWGIISYRNATAPLQLAVNENTSAPLVTNTISYARDSSLSICPQVALEHTSDESTPEEDNTVSMVRTR